MNTQTAAIKLKANLFTLTILQVFDDNMDCIANELQAQIASAPKFFKHTPVILDFSDKSLSATALRNFIKYLRTHDILPIGVISDHIPLQGYALKYGLAIFPKNRTSTQEKIKNPDPISPQPLKPPTTQSSTSFAKIIVNPVRSGQQIYAKNTDLIILNSVSHGAEVMADGNIHIYGALYGRALAGVNGNTQARIFCQKLNAELISIAGLYQLSDDFNLKKSTENLQVYLNDQKLHIETL
jgi:septum site-determining protein MinC